MSERSGDPERAGRDSMSERWGDPERAGRDSMRATATSTDPWRQRVESGDWKSIAAEVNSLGGALLPELLTVSEAAQIRELYQHHGHFRSTVDMDRHRFGAGEYRYFKTPCPEPVEIGRAHV